ncbi:Amino acid transporter [Thermoplasmatales archaeon BRNA1]|nr:Amino acid transporter [Thermoplasmatales archaeon BRNA1]
MVEENGQASGSQLERTVSWKDGMFVALGVPLLILPGLYDVGSMIWALCIFTWTVGVLQGFVQNIAYAEMVTTFPQATGIPGCAQAVFQSENAVKGQIDKSKFIGAFASWCYWFAWTPVVYIFSGLIVEYIGVMFDLDLSDVEHLGLSMAVILIVVAGMYILGSRGLEGGGKLALILALISLIPIIVILFGDIGDFEFDNITDAWKFPTPGYSDSMSIVLILGCFGLGQWSSCAWETAAIYGPEYKDPGRDTPKALFSCGLICLALYFLVPFLMYGEIGQVGLEDAGYHSLHPIAIAAFGNIGGKIALVVLIIAMILIIQTGFLGSSRALYSMSTEGNLPSWFGKLNEHGMPVHAMLFVAGFNSLLMFVLEVLPMLGADTSVMTVLSASAMGYAIANFVALAAFVKSRRDPRFKDLPRPFQAPSFYTYVGMIMCCLQIVLLVCLVYWSYVASGDSVLPAILGCVILLCFIPVWVMEQKKQMA